MRRSVLPEASRIVGRLAWSEGHASDGVRVIPEETALALTYNGGTYAVMMGSPRDLEDFALGFSRNAGVIENAHEMESLEIVEVDNGIELRMWLTSSKAAWLSERRRFIAGPTGCGICGVDSIAEAVRPVAAVGAGATVSADHIMKAMRSIAGLQELNAATRAVHAAAFWTPQSGVVALREDVGRHNALDKLAGALLRQEVCVEGGVLLLTSRVSVELVQKAAAMGACIMVAVSAPTTLAVQTAEAAGITLVAVARDDGFEIFTHLHRVERDELVDRSDSAAGRPSH
jgi:FdhD protein